MNIIKKYKNILIILSILLIIFGGTKLIDFAESIAKSVEKYFSKPDYSNLNSQSKKYQSSIKTSQKNPNNNSSTKSMFSSPKEKTAEQLDKEIMNKTNQNSSKKDIKFNEKKINDKDFDIDFKELDDF